MSFCTQTRDTPYSRATSLLLRPSIVTAVITSRAIDMAHLRVKEGANYVPRQVLTMSCNQSLPGAQHMVPLRLRLMGPLRRRSHDMAPHRLQRERQRRRQRTGTSFLTSWGPATAPHPALLDMLTRVPDSSPPARMKRPSRPVRPLTVVGACARILSRRNRARPTDPPAAKHRRAQLMNQRTPAVLLAAVEHAKPACGEGRSARSRLDIWCVPSWDRQARPALAASENR